jgi:hypothetical protein
MRSAAIGQNANVAPSFAASSTDDASGQIQATGDAGTRETESEAQNDLSLLRPHSPSDPHQSAVITWSSHAFFVFFVSFVVHPLPLRLCVS